MHSAGRTATVFHSCQRLLSCPRVFMCSHVYLLPFQCRLVWPGVSPHLDLSSCAQDAPPTGGSVMNDTGLSLCFFFFFFVISIYLFICWNGITGLTSKSQMWSNYLLKDKCGSYTWVNLTPLVIKTKVKKKENGKTGTPHVLKTMQPSCLALRNITVIGTFTFWA